MPERIDLGEGWVVKNAGGLDKCQLDVLVTGLLAERQKRIAMVRDLLIDGVVEYDAPPSEGFRKDEG